MPLLDPLAFIPAASDGSGSSGLPRLLSLEASMATRHGLIAGATGTGKTVTLQALAERLSRAGTAVFLADAKGDLAGLAAPGRSVAEGGNAKIEAALAAAGLADGPRAGLPAVLWDVFGEKGHPLRATISEMGPLVLARALGLTETQGEVLSIVFRIADERGLLLLDLKDLRSVLEFCMKNAAALESAYGRMADSSLGAIQRAVVVLEGQGGDRFFGEPALAIGELLGRDAAGRGLVHILAAERLLESPALYAAFMLWLLSELFEELPEAGDLPAPKLVFFFDEAHLLFDGAPPELVRSLVRTVRLIRSKGVGVWFVTQNPLDLPEEVLAQLGNRVQHALRAFSEKELRGLQAVASSFRPNPRIDARAQLSQLGVGEALVSFLDAQGVPTPVEVARIVPPLSRVGSLGQEERAKLLAASPFAGRYETALDRPSAYETLRSGSVQAARGQSATGPSEGSPAGNGARAPSLEEEIAALEAELRGELPLGRSGDSGGAPEPDPVELYGTGQATGGSGTRPRRTRPTVSPQGLGGRQDGGELLEGMARSVLRAAGTEMGRQLVRGLLGGMSGRSRRRRS
jgi:DNA helicase HerA-like ATPase